MRLSKILLGTLAYAAITFPLAYVWHLVAFKDTYDRLGYIDREEPIVAFGFLAIVAQGWILAVVYPSLCRGLSIPVGAAKLFVVMGGYHWTVHVLAEAAKHPIDPLTTWFAVESVYLAIQFALAALLMALVYAQHTRPEPT